MCESLTGVWKDPYREKAVIQGIPREAKAQWSGGLNRSSDEVSVMEMERRI